MTIRYDATPETVAKIKKLIAGMGNQSADQLDSMQHQTGQQVAFVKCGDVADEDNKVYEGTIVLMQSLDLTWQEMQMPVYLTEANDNDLVADTYYLAIGYGDYDIEDDVRQLFVCQLGGGGGGGTTLTVSNSTGSQTCVGPDTLKFANTGITVGCSSGVATVTIPSTSLTYVTGGSVTTTVSGTVDITCNDDGTFSGTFSLTAESDFSPTTSTITVLT